MRVSGCSTGMPGVFDSSVARVAGEYPRDRGNGSVGTLERLHHAMIHESERPPGVSSVGNRIWGLVNCTAVNRTCLPCDPPHVKCG